MEKQKKAKNKVVASADNQTVLMDTELEQEDEKSDEDGQQLHRPSNIVVVRDGGKVLVPVSSLKSTEKEATDSNDFAMATRLRSKDKEVRKSQKAKGGKQPALAAVQKGTPGAAATKSPNNNTPTATSGQKRTSPRRSSSGKKTPPSTAPSATKKTPSKSSSAQKSTPSNTSTGKRSTQSKSSGVSVSRASKKRKERSSDDNRSSKKKKVTVPSSAIPSNAEDDDIVEIVDGSQVRASEVHIVEVAESSQVYEADQPFRPIIRVDDSKVQAHKKLFYEQLEGHYSNMKTFNLMT